MNEKEQLMSENTEIDILELLRAFWMNRAVIFILVLVCSFAMFVKTYCFTDDTYTASGILYVSNKRDASGENEAIQKSDIDSSRSLSTTYIEILKTSYFLEEVGRASGGYSWKEISKMVTVSSVNETELLKITVTADSAAGAYIIAKNILQKAPNKLISVYKSGEAEIVDPPRMPNKANNKGVFKNTVLGAAAGIVLGAIITFVERFFDKKVRSGEDAEKRYGVSILGELAD